MSASPRSSLTDALLSPAVYPVPTTGVELVETHISLVFLLDRDVFKVKKPLDLGFLDFSTLELRRFFCEEEVRLNRRLAPHVYRGVVEIRRTPDGIRVCPRGDAPADGELIEFAVHMERLPDRARLADRLAAGKIADEFWPMLGARLANFHASAERSAAISRDASFECLAKNARDNLTDTACFVGTAIAAALHERLSNAIEAALTELRPVFEDRAARGVPCDTHGDLRLDHVYHFPERHPPDDLVIIDGIEFSTRFRHADPISDVAFLVMDLLFTGKGSAAHTLMTSYLEASGDNGRLFPWYIAYRSAVRAKVDHLTLAHAELAPQRSAYLTDRALGHWLLALGELEPPLARPALVLIGGPPGCGKSSVAEELEREARFEWIRSDVVRREIFSGLGGSDLYTPERVAAVYEACLERADAVIREGRRALIDATYHADAPRCAAIDLAERRHVPCVFIELTIDRETAHERIRGRKNDPSDADCAVHDQLVAEWEPVEEKSARVRAPVDAGKDRATVAAAALQILDARGIGPLA